MGEHPRLAYRVEEAAAAIGIGRTKVWELIQTGDLPARKIGTATVIRHEDLRAYVDAAPLAEATKRAQSINN